MSVLGLTAAMGDAPNVWGVPLTCSQADYRTVVTEIIEALRICPR
ncbi:hypothetical protein [Mycolicibacterium llatzerense]|nr:hypothetical protein [Mycolicibacterium llatzerense]